MNIIRLVAARLLPVVIAISTIVFGALFTAPSAYSIEGNKKVRLTEEAYHPHRLLVKFKRGVPQKQIDALTRSVGAIKVTRFKQPRGLGPKGRMGQWRTVTLPGGVPIRRIRDRLLKNPNVESVEFDFKININQIPNDPSFGQLWGLHNVSQTGGTTDADIDAPEAWNITTGNVSTIVAVIDTGVDYNHPDLAANIWVNAGEIPGNGIDDDNNGYVDDVHGYDFVNNDGDPFDDNSHGTHVAGTIAAVGNNGIGVAGVNWTARVMAVKFLDAGGSGFTSDAISAILYAAANGAKVTNNSWGGGGFSQALKDAIATGGGAGSLFVAAAGNSNSNNDITPSYPASYDLPDILSVAATDHNDAKASFSSYGVTTVDLGAPGVNVYSTTPGNTYSTFSGTSMATPHVAGAATLLLSQFPGITHLQIKERLMNTADPVPSMAGITVTGGRLNVANSMEDDSVPPDSATDLAVSNAGGRSISLFWSATGDDGSQGQASSYDLRYSTTPIDANNFDSATSAGYVQATGPAGTAESFKVSGLDQLTTYYFALKVLDNVGNASGISNVISATTGTVAVIFKDTMENTGGNWTVDGDDGLGGPALWHLSNHRSNSPTTAFYYGKADTLDYDTGARNYGSITSTPISLVGVTGAWLSFYHFLETENFGLPYDVAAVLVSVDGGVSWVSHYQNATNTAGGMERVDIDLSAYDDQVIQLRFSFDTGDSAANFFEGWVVDDVEVSADNTENDPVSPAPVSDLIASAVLDATAVNLSWSATGDDGLEGIASVYDLRYSTTPIDLTNFDAATPVPAILVSGPAGTPEAYVVNGLQAQTTYYFALKVIDNVSNASDISNIASATTDVSSVPFWDDMESGTGKWVITGSDGLGGPSLWHTSPHRFNSPGNAFYYGKEDTLTYETGATNSGEITSIPIDLSFSTASALVFYHFLETENLSPFDNASVRVSSNGGGTWTNIYSSSIGTNGLIEKVVLDLSIFDGQVIQLRFAFDTVDGAFNTFEGWVIDDVKVASLDQINKPPVADAGGPYSGHWSQPIVFDGSASFDPDADTIVSYTWGFGDGVMGTGVNPSHTYAAPGEYIVTLVVNDGLKNSLPSMTSALLTNVAPVANAGGPYSGLRNQEVAFNGAGSTDPDNDPIVSYTWNFGDGTTGTGVNPSHIYVSSGTYNVSLVVSDGFNNSQPAVTNITVTNLVPMANPGGPYITYRNTNHTFDGSASIDLNGDPLTYAWNFGDGSTGTGVNPVHSYQTIGTFNVSLVVSDGEDESIPVYTTIIVTNAPPVANAGADLQVIGTSTVILDGRGSLDKDGDIVSYEWTQIGGDRNVGIKNKNAAVASFRAPNPKEPITYTLYFELQVTDNDGAIGTDQVTVYIYPGP